MNDNLTDDVVIFRTGQLFEIDMASNLLKEIGIPFHTREETSGGLKLAMPAAPATGPGVWWCLIVPRTHSEQALKELEALPFCQGTDPGVWGFRPRPRIKLAWKIIIGCALLTSAIAALWDLIEIFR
jgi:hypothetical protein